MPVTTNSSMSENARALWSFARRLFMVPFFRRISSTPHNAGSSLPRDSRPCRSSSIASVDSALLSNSATSFCNRSSSFCRYSRGDGGNSQS